MRILQVRFKNLNSLVGEWQIDLTHPAFVSDGIFAIIGPTGAGKTTILDAICLALYGRTPRLNRVTKSGNEIMSRQTGECFAEVTFETQSGRYRCHWSQHRARKKPDGELQPPKHEIAHADSGEIVESKIRGVANQIESATGMDFERFTRSMLLAQGGFAAFLQAAPDDRAPILEQITGTEIYSLISIRVHERLREEQETLKLLQAETAGVVILEPAQEQALEQTLETGRQAEAGLTAQYADLKRAIDWLVAIDGLQKEVASLTDEAVALQNEAKAFKPDQATLEQALHAASLDAVYATLTTTRQQQADDKASQDTAAAALPALASATQEKADALALAEQHTVRSKQVLQAAAPTLQQVRALDQTLANQTKMIAEEAERCHRLTEKINADTQAWSAVQEKRSRVEAALGLVDDYLKTHAQDAWLVGGLAGIQEQLGGLADRQQEIAQKEAQQQANAKRFKQAAQLFEDHRQQVGKCKQELETAFTLLQQGKRVLEQLLGGRLLREYRSDKDALLREMALLTKIAELEDHRQKLEAGKPCPLCGATEHPFATGNVPVPDHIEQKIYALTTLIEQAEGQDAENKRLAEAEGQARASLAEAEKRMLIAANDKQVAETALVELKGSVALLRADFIERRQALMVSLRPLGLTALPETGLTALLASLRARLNTWQAQVKDKADLEKQIGAIEGDLKRLSAVVDTQRATLAEQQRHLDNLEKTQAARAHERQALYGDKRPDDEERRLNKTVIDAEAAEKQARAWHHECQQRWQAAHAHVESLQKSIRRRAPELDALEARFLAALGSVGFVDEAQFLAARLTPERRAELGAAAKALEQRQIHLQARQKDRETRLTAEMARQVTNESLSVLEPQLNASEAALTMQQETNAGLRHQLSENTAAKARIQEKHMAIEAQKNECRRWENLHELIGSADGKKYRNFAQGLTFEMMVGHANQQLQKMTDRYLLVRDAAQPLELNVVDNYQAGEIRSTKNLSGGESFIVSLSLALGLSHMASKNVRVDSLFLDEGFGTLDEDALDIALETLASLQQDGKLIGIISHVPALKERISTQIQVTPQTGGRSRISGPGCRRLAGAA